MEVIRELLGKIKLFARFEIAVADKLDDHEKRLYKLEENKKLKDAAILQMQKELGELRLILNNIRREV